MFLGMALMALAIFLKPALARRVPLEPTALRNPQAPWGDLEYSYFALGQPDKYLPDSTNALPSPAWYFERTTPEAVTALFNSVDTPAAVRTLLLDTNRWQISGDTVVVHPTSEVLLGLGPPARERIYAVLGISPINMPQYYPFRFRADGFDRWFAQSRLAPEKLRLIRSLTYTNRGGAMCLADIDVLQQTLGAEDFRNLFESLYSEQSLFLSVRVKPSADIERLAQYWGSGGREQEVATMLKSLAKTPGGGSINVAYLLPPFARLRLYTFALATSDTAASGQDCFWTVLNFFKSESEAQITTRDRSLERLMAEYVETLEPPRFGDAVLLLENRKPAHACVYIADDVVFTKNGVNYHQPWVLMKLNDLLPRYASDRPMSIVVLRRRST